MVYLLLFFIGLCLGSFVNALVWRIFKQEELKEQKPKDIGKRLRDMSILHGRSVCPHCNHKLASKDLIPVFSWITLSGKCRYCNKRISWQYPLVELVVAVLAVVSYYFWPHAHHSWTTLDAVTFANWLLLLTGLTALAVYDFRWRLLPDRIVFPLIALGVVFTLLLVWGPESWTYAVVAAEAAFIISGLFFALFQMSKGMWIGGGDVKLGVLLGLLAAGVLPAFLLLFLASFLGTLYSLILMATGGMKPSRGMQIPFGPFLIAATFITVLFAQDILSWYSDFILGL
jgi:leader peptidase (prepilin peptidase)/N-methyltransferase